MHKIIVIIAIVSVEFRANSICGVSPLFACLSFRECLNFFWWSEQRTPPRRVVWPTDLFLYFSTYPLDLLPTHSIRINLHFSPINEINKINKTIKHYKYIPTILSELKWPLWPNLKFYCLYLGILAGRNVRNAFFTSTSSTMWFFIRSARGHAKQFVTRRAPAVNLL